MSTGTKDVKDFYTNVAIHRNNVLVIGYRDGQRYQNKYPYKPYLFLPSKKDDAEYRDIYGAPADIIRFDSISEARQFSQRYSGVGGFTYYGMERFQYPYIFDSYPGKIKYDGAWIRRANIDIETANEFQGFPSVETVPEQITLIGIGIGDKRRIVFGWGEFEGCDDRRVEFIRCLDERSMLLEFLKWWSDPNNTPDIITGWNIEKFDIPYIVNRIRKVLGEIDARRLSPWGILREKTVEIYNREHTIYLPVGISVLDYYELYRKFTYTQLESYSLDHVAFIETGKGKLDYTEYASLQDLYKNDYNKFVKYNVTDIDRVQDIDAKKKFIDLVLAIAYDAKVNFNDALTSVQLWDVIIHNYLLERKIVVPRSFPKQLVEIPGAYVKDPRVGLSHWVVSFDLTSLYPHLIMQYNISPEKLHSYDEEWSLDKFRSLLHERFDRTEALDTDTTIAANGARFKRDSIGFLPELMQYQFDLRSAYKKQMLEAQKENEEIKAILEKRGIHLNTT